MPCRSTLDKSSPRMRREHSAEYVIAKLVGSGSRKVGALGMFVLDSSNGEDGAAIGVPLKPAYAKKSQMKLSELTRCRGGLKLINPRDNTLLSRLR